ncbi:MAG TPA: GNAT family N-acetyltransferase [Ktedonobacterales bacterium]|nr:GNAT family N-acetyltransferase [Ktedonobacterales bacterium]
MIRIETGACAILEAPETRATLIPEWWEAPRMQPIHQEERPTRVMRRPLATRPYAGESDLPAIIELLLAHKATSAQPERPSVAELRSALDSAHQAPTLATRLWITSSGTLVAFALLRGSQASAHLTVIIHPQERASDRWLAILDEIVIWALTQAGDLARKRGHAMTLTVECSNADEALAQQLVAHGFKPRAGESVWLARSLDDKADLANSSLPAGYRLRMARSDEAELAAYVMLFNEAFASDSVNRLTVSQRRAFLADADHVPELDLVVEAPDGTPAGFVRCVSHAEERERLGRREGEVAQLGVAPAHQRMGLGRALLRVGLHALRESGASLALLRARTDNHAAQQLYTAEGFTARSHVTTFAQVME